MEFNPNQHCILCEILFTDTPVQQWLHQIMTQYSLNKWPHSHVSFSTNTKSIQQWAGYVHLLSFAPYCVVKCLLRQRSVLVSVMLHWTGSIRVLQFSRAPPHVLHCPCILSSSPFFQRQLTLPSMDAIKPPPPLRRDNKNKTLKIHFTPP